MIDRIHLPLSVFRLYATLSLATILLVASPPGRGDDDDVVQKPWDAPSPVSNQAGGKVNLTQEQMKVSGLRVEPLSPAVVTGEARLPGRILDIQPLLDLRAAYRAAQADLAVAGAALGVAGKSKQRLTKLHQESIVATRELNQAEATFAAEHARAGAARVRLDQIRETIQQQWGPDLLGLVMDDKRQLLSKLRDRSHLLGLMTMVPGQSSPTLGAALRIVPAGQSGDGTAASLLGPAPRTDEITQGETWYFVSPSGRLRTGMRVEVYLADGSAIASGVAVPAAAIVWYAGLPWVYIKTSDTEFVRRPIESHQEQAERWLVPAGFKAGEQVVVVGAQMLISQELKGRIPEEDDD